MDCGESPGAERAEPGGHRTGDHVGFVHADDLGGGAQGAEAAHAFGAETRVVVDLHEAGEATASEVGVDREVRAGVSDVLVPADEDSTDPAELGGGGASVDLDDAVVQRDATGRGHLPAEVVDGGATHLDGWPAIVGRFNDLEHGGVVVECGVADDGFACVRRHGWLGRTGHRRAATLRSYVVEVGHREMHRTGRVFNDV